MIGNSSISMAMLDWFVTSSANSTTAGLVNSETIRWAPMAAGITMWSAPACRSFLGVVGPSARAMITRPEHICRAVRVMNTFSASSGMTLTTTLARSMPASIKTFSSVASPVIARNPRSTASWVRSRGDVDDHKRVLARGQLVANQPADPAVTDDNRVSR